MSKKILSGFKFFGYLFYGIGIVYLLYALYALCLVFIIGCDIARFFYNWGGFPFLVLSFFELKVGKMFLKAVFRNLKYMLLAVGFTDILFGYLFIPWVDKLLRIAFWLTIYAIAFVYAMRLEANQQNL